jgi:hypothetical protein
MLAAVHDGKNGHAEDLGLLVSVEIFFFSVFQEGLHPASR